MDGYQQPYILRLKGITLDDWRLPEDVLDERLSADAAPAPPPEDSADRIPATFTCIEEHPESTNLRCWACGFRFDGPPKFIPRSVRECDCESGFEFSIEGNMCTWNCVARWVIDTIGGRASNEDRWRIQNNMNMGYFLFTGVFVEHIEPAPCRTELKQYGGPLDDEAFWKRLRELDPVGGLRDHTPGSIVPERERPGMVRELLSLRTNLGLKPAHRLLTTVKKNSSARRIASPGAPIKVSPRSAWSVCGLSAAEPDPLDVIIEHMGAGAAADDAAVPDMVEVAAIAFADPPPPPPPAPAPVTITDADLEELLGF